MKKIKVDKVILYYMDRVDPDGNLYRFYVYKDMASEIEYFCTEETGNMTIPIGEGEYVKKNDFRIVLLDYDDMTLGDYDNTGENEQVAYFINYCLNQDKDGKE